jgi:hypothetical protein
LENVLKKIKILLSKTVSECFWDVIILKLDTTLNLNWESKLMFWECSRFAGDTVSDIVSGNRSTLEPDLATMYQNGVCTSSFQ